jgi:glycosyltransferase involved in cell wall biosynthesis
MGDQPLVSVVIATNRLAPYLAEAIASVAAQTWPRIELIVVDDGAPDPAPIEQAAAAVPGAIVLHQPPSGVSAARNHGASRASGEYLAFLDDDDRWHPSRIERHVEAMRRRPAAVLSYCRLTTIDATGTKQLAPPDQIELSTPIEVARGRTAIIAPNIVVRADAFAAAGGFRPDLRRAEDLDLVLSITQQGPVVFVPHPLVDYRFTGTNVTSNHRALGLAIKGVLRRPRAEAVARGDRDLAAALRENEGRNARYIWWASLRAARAALRSRRPGAAVAEVWGALVSAPTGLASGILHRLGSS